MGYSIRRLTAMIGCALTGAALFASPLAIAADSDVLLLPSPDLSKLQLEDSKSIGGAYRYGIQVPVESLRVDANSAAGGSWVTQKDGSLRWSREIASPGALTLDFHFSKLQLPTGAALVIRGVGKGNARSISADALSGNGEFWSPYVLGEKATLEVTVPAALRDKLVLELSSVTHGYRGLFEAAGGLEKSGSCNVDTVCPAGDTWRDQIDAVGHYTFSQGSSSYVCTGTLVGNTALTTTPYFLTANHCVSTATVAGTIVVYWNYQSATCRTPGSSASGSPLSKTIATHSQSGTTLIATNAASDFALLRLNANVPAAANPYFSGWDVTGTTPTSAAGIHHPAGHEKRIAIEDQALQVSAYGGGTGTTHWRVVDWDQGTTEGGSSGSGLWNQSKHLVGQLHGGSAACGNNLSDYYGRLSVSWSGAGTDATRLNTHLAPSSSATTLNGYRSGGSGNVAPTANYSFTVSGLTASFSDSSTDSDGSIASRSWNFGDGTTSTATNPSKTYSAAGTYTVTLTVTDNGAATNATSKSVTVTATTPPPTGGTLTKGVAVTGLAATAGNALNYTLAVPAGSTNLTFTMSGGTGDADLYVRFGSAPTDTVYDCRPYLGGNAETCTIATPSAGTYHVRVKAFSTFSGVSLVGNYTAGSTGGGVQTYTNGTDFAIRDKATIESPIAVSGRTGNAPSTSKVDVRILHTYRGDLKVDLVAPDGSVYVLHNRTGGSADNIITEFTVNLSSEALNGSWKLRVNDNANGDTGTLDTWSLVF